ncbi:riboflavin biosynthesis protein RibT [Fructobacillus cardui]|uniref:riboflavin biosynthesis protein RibT n=1 Tax=Fructobacillus cardui TaxID=2893170 RepID=UPI00200B77AB|nr:riboflavin biosynthesis protein RibT [Fructobacillus cardui]MCK8627947.1 riboflavin biosynthesis protein RibT [Fructobacillus cardui]
MLISTRPDDEKTVMGLFSLLPEYKNLDHMKLVLNLYQQPKMELFFWQPDQQDSINGLLGFERYKDNVLVVRHLILTPGAPKKATHAQMLTDLQELNPDYTMMGTLSTQTYIDKWRKHYSKPKSHN